MNGEDLDRRSGRDEDLDLRSGRDEGLERFSGGRRGKARESDLGIYFYQSRWYDPKLSRFLQADSVVPDPYNSQAWDRFAYGYGNPTNRVDPTGHETCFPKQCGYMHDYDDNRPATEWIQKIAEEYYRTEKPTGTPTPYKLTPTPESSHTPTLSIESTHTSTPSATLSPSATPEPSSTPTLYVVYGPTNIPGTPINDIVDGYIDGILDSFDLTQSNPLYPYDWLTPLEGAQLGPLVRPTRFILQILMTGRHLIPDLFLPNPLPMKTPMPFPDQ